MRQMVVILLYDPDAKQMLLRARASDPYRGLLDFVAGRCGAEETAQACAYRALEEETGIDRASAPLQHIMDFAYHTTGWCVQVFAGTAAQRVPVEAPLCWVPLEGEDFFETTRYAGEGYIGHILAHMRMQLFAPEN